MTKTALISGIFGQDGAYLSRLLISKGYNVIGGVRRSSTFNDWRLCELGIDQQIKLIDMELFEQSNIRRIIRTHQPDEIYNLAAQSFVAASFEQPVYTTEVNALPVTYLLEAIRDYAPDSRFYQASTSEMFGLVQETPQKETTPFHPRSPYGVAKLYGHWMTTMYREAYDLFACSGILFNHESPLRGTDFVTRKVTSTLARIKFGSNEVLELGNLSAQRDWGYAAEYVDAMWAMLQRETPENFLIATGKTHTVKSFVSLALDCFGISVDWIGDNEEEHAVDSETGKPVIRINPKYYRPAEVDLWVGDPSYAKEQLNWQAKVELPELVEKMARADFDREKANCA